MNRPNCGCSCNELEAYMDDCERIIADLDALQSRLSIGWATETALRLDWQARAQKAEALLEAERQGA